MALKAKTTRRDRPDKDKAIEEATKPDTKRLNAEIPRELHSKLKTFAAQNETKITEVVIEAITEYLSKNSFTQMK
ncbi:MAG: plasmid partition protein ParG [Cyanobacteria bacterium J06623_1]